MVRNVLKALRQHWQTAAVVFGLCSILAAPAAADVIVLANRTGREMPIRFVPLTGQARQISLRVAENLPLYLDGKANVSFSSPGGSKSYLLDSNCAYFLGRGPDGRIDLQKIGLGEDGTLSQGHTLPGTASQAPIATIPVKILVDEDEPGRPNVWEQRLRRRVEAASAVFEKYFNTRLQVVAVGTWKSDDATNDFMASLVRVRAPGRSLARKARNRLHEPVDSREGTNSHGGHPRSAAHPYSRPRREPKHQRSRAT